MKIAFIGQKGLPAHGGGVERYVEDLSSRLAARGHEVVVYSRAHYTSRSRVRYRGVRLLVWPTIHTKYLDAISHTFLAVLHATRSDYDIIHWQSIGPALLCWLPRLLGSRAKIVATLQSRDYEHQKWGVLARTCLKLGEWLMCHLADELIVVTRDMERYVSERYGRQAVYAPNGANLYEPVGSEELMRWGLRPGGYLVAVSRLVRHKGLHHLITAYQSLGEINQPLVIVGEGAFTDNYVMELKRLAKGNPRIIFTGNQSGETLAQLYANAYLFIQPSSSEGLSLALLEAMARRVPVLVSDIAANQEAVGEAGFVFTDQDAVDLGKRLAYLLANPDLTRAGGEAGRDRVSKFFNWDKIAVEIEKIYQRPANLTAVKSKATI